MCGKTFCDCESAVLISGVYVLIRLFANFSIKQCTHPVMDDIRNDVTIDKMAVLVWDQRRLEAL